MRHHDLKASPVAIITDLGFKHDPLKVSRRAVRQFSRAPGPRQCPESPANDPSIVGLQLLIRCNDRPAELT